MCQLCSRLWFKWYGLPLCIWPPSLIIHALSWTAGDPATKDIQLPGVRDYNGSSSAPLKNERNVLERSFEFTEQRFGVSLCPEFNMLPCPTCSQRLLRWQIKWPMWTELQNDEVNWSGVIYGYDKHSRISPTHGSLDFGMRVPSSLIL